MQDIDFLKHDSPDAKVLVLWLIPFLLISVFFFSSVIESYSEVLYAKSQWQSLPEQKANNKSGSMHQSPDNKNIYLSRVFAYFSDIDSDNIIINTLAVDRLPLIKVSGEASDINTMSMFASTLSESDLFEDFNDYRLSVNRSQIKGGGVQWTIEWLR